MTIIGTFMIGVWVATALLLESRNGERGFRQGEVAFAVFVLPLIAGMTLAVLARWIFGREAETTGLLAGFLGCLAYLLWPVARDVAIALRKSRSRR